MSATTETKVYVGAGWLSPGGTIEGCGHTEHSEKAREIVLDRYKRDYEAAQEKDPWASIERILDKRGWVRVSGDGKVTDSDWQRVRKLSNSQFDTLWDMLSAAREESAKATKTGGYHYISNVSAVEFIGNLAESLRMVSEEG